MAEVMEPMIHEDQLPGHESKLEPKPDWEPRYPGSGRLKGKVAMITGADSGIGRAVAALYAREGADIAILYLCEHDDASKSKEIVEKEGRHAITIAGDIGDKQFCERAVQQTVEQLGKLDILVNNAGEQHYDEDIGNITEEQLKRTFQTNIFGDVLLDPGRASAPQRGVGDRQLHVGNDIQGLARTARLQLHQRSDHRLHAVAGEEPRQEGHPRERRRAGSDLDATEPVGGQPPEKIPEFRQGHADGSPRPAE